MNEKNYDKALRILGMGFAVAIWGVSIFFSVRGFDFDMNNMPWTLSISLILGFSVTVIELLWNRTTYEKDTMFYIIGILAYCYGTYTNIIGIAEARGEFLGPLEWVLPVLVGAFVEIVPEKLFMKSMRELNRLGSPPQNMSGAQPNKPVEIDRSKFVNPRDVRFRDQEKPATGSNIPDLPEWLR